MIVTSWTPAKFVSNAMAMAWEGMVARGSPLSGVRFGRLSLSNLDQQDAQLVRGS